VVSWNTKRESSQRIIVAQVRIKNGETLPATLHRSDEHQCQRRSEFVADIAEKLRLGTEHLPAERVQATQTLASTTIRAEAYVEEALQWSGDESDVAVDVAMPGKRLSLASSADPKAAEKRELIIVADDNAECRIR